MQLLLIDDHALFRDAVEALVARRHPKVQVLHAATLAEAHAQVVRQPDLRLALLDLGMPDGHGLAEITRLRDAAAKLVVIVVSADDRPETVVAAIDAGAAGFIPKTAQRARLEAALDTVFAGGVAAPGGAAEPPRGAGIEMSPRQRDVLRLLVEGRTNKQICRELGLSESTVKTHLEAIFRKLGVVSRTQAVLAAARLGLRLGR